MADAKGTSNGIPHSSIELKDPDAVQKGIIDVWGWLEEHAKIVAALLVVFILGAIAWVATNSFRSYQEKKAQEAYYSVEAKYQKTKEGFDRAKFKNLMPDQAKADKAAPIDQPATGDLAKDYGSTLTELEKVARDHAGTAGGAQAAILAATTYLEYKQPDKAAEVADVAVKSLSEKQLMASLARVVLGNALATKGDCANAVQAWQKILDNKTAAFLHGDVGLRSGLCYEQMNEPAKAEEMYRKVTSESSDSAAATTAKGLLRALELKKTSGPAGLPAKQGS